jgi:hypothetical protein
MAELAVALKLNDVLRDEVHALLSISSYNLQHGLCGQRVFVLAVNKHGTMLATALPALAAEARTDFREAALRQPR